MVGNRKSKARKVTRKAPSPVVAPASAGPHMIGYARVSMADQNNQRQIDELVKYGVDPLDIYTDKASGRDMKRPGWAALWKDLQGPDKEGEKGDLLVIHSIDRLGRDLIEIVRTMHELHDRGCDLKILSMDIDTRTIVGKFVFSIMAAFAEMERLLIVERTMHGLQRARERGSIGGRKQTISDKQAREAMARIRKGEDATAVAAEYGVSRQAVYKRDAKLRKEREAKRSTRGVALAMRIMRVTKAVLEEEYGC